MSTKTKQQNDVTDLVLNALKKNPSIMRTVSEGTELHRVQDATHDASPIHYARVSDTRYADPDQAIGVKYVAGSDVVAIAESFQGTGQDQRTVEASLLASKSIHRLKAVRDLKLVDVTVLAARSTKSPLHAMVNSRYDDGYDLPRQLSQACMQIPDVDGLIYPSAVLSPAGTFAGCNLVLFEHRPAQVLPLDYQPVLEVELSTGETAKELLDDLGVTLV
jgi:hypothetical protein